MIAALGAGAECRARSALGAGVRASLLLLVLSLLAGCAGNGASPPTLRRPLDTRATLGVLIPDSVVDRKGWAIDIAAAVTTLDIDPSSANLCAILAVIEQESSYRADPQVPGLGKLAWGEIDRRAESLGVPVAAVHLALRLPSSNGRTYAERIDAARTEQELSLIFEDLIDRVPMGKRLFARWNPVRTGGPMQVAIGFAERHATQRSYPYPVAESIRHEVFSRRGGLYFGIAHLFDYPADYDRHLYRFADFNAGHYASRNAGFQNAVSLVSGIPLDLDGDLIRRAGEDDAPGETEIAARTVARRFGMGAGAVRDALELGTGVEFAGTELYRQTFELADRLERKPVPRAVVPRIVLKSPKIKRKLTTEWFATRVEARQKKCLDRAAAITEGRA